MKKTFHMSKLFVTLIFLLSTSSELIHADDFGFRFVRIKFNTWYGDRSSGGRRGWGRGGRGTPPWEHDYPTAELNLYDVLQQTTKIKIHGEPLVLTLSDKRIFEYPILYLCEPGFWNMEEEEVLNLREYFRRGGFVIFDDFRGRNEWDNFYYQIKRVFPKKEFEEVLPDHPIWSVYYEVDPVAAVSLVSGRYGRYSDEYYAMYDNDRRMMMIVCYNQDIGDGWEWPDRNYDHASTDAFKMGVNFIIWALTH